MKKFKKVFGLVITLVVGVVLVGFSIAALSAPDVDYQTTTGTIVDIQEETDAEDFTSGQTYVDYTVDGKEYTHVEFGSYSSSMKLGDKVTVLYDPADPTHIQAEGTEFVPYVVLVVGILILLSIPVGFIWRKIRR